jgi:Retrotransposon gag protein
MPRTAEEEATTPEAARRQTVNGQIVIGNVTGSLALIPEFSGGQGSMPVTEFFDYIDRVGSISAWLPDQLLNVAIIKLVGKAKDYFNSHPEVKSLRTWDEFKASMITKFQPKIPGVYADYHFRTCVQGPDEGVDEYAARLRIKGEATLIPPQNEEQRRYAQLVLDQNLLNYFLNGIKHSLKPWVLTHDPTSFDQAVKLAKTEETNAMLLARSRKGLFSVADLPEAPPSSIAPPQLNSQHQQHTAPTIPVQSCQFSGFGCAQPLPYGVPQPISYCPGYYPQPYPSQVNYPQMPIAPQTYAQVLNPVAQPTYQARTPSAPRFPAPRYSNPVNNHEGRNSYQSSDNRRQPQNDPQQVVECQNCGARGHTGAACSRPYRPVCQACGRRGHESPNCFKTNRQSPNGQRPTAGPGPMANRR